MRRTTTAVAALLFSSAALASSSGCQADSDPTSRLACYDQMAATIADCQTLTDKLDRLVCFDNISQAIKTALGSSNHITPVVAAPVVAAAAAPVIATIPEPQVTPDDSVSRFGKETVIVKEVDEITAKVTKVATDPYGKWTLTLDNDQRWRQTESSRLSIHNGDTVVITRAALGSFLLKREGSNRQVRVKRK